MMSSPFVSLAALPFVLLFPGALLVLFLGTIKLEGGRRLSESGASSVSGRPPLELGEALFVVVLVSLVFTVWFGITLAELGRFSLLWYTFLWFAILVLAVALVAARAAISRIHSGSQALRRVFVSPFDPASALPFSGRPDRWSLAVLPVLLLAATLFFRPAEFVFGGTDPGVYLNTAIALGRFGAIILPDPETPRLDAEERRALFGNVPVPWQRSGLPGFTMLDFSTGEMEPHGFHLYPVWLAIWGVIGGVSGVLYGTPILGLLSVATMFFLGRRVAGPWVGLGGALLLTLNIGQIWFARVPSAESLTELLLLAGALLLAIALSYGSVVIAVVSGLAFGLVHLTKIDLVGLPIALIALLAWTWIRGKWSKYLTALSLAYLAISAQAVVHALLFAPAYVIGTATAAAPGLDHSATDFADPSRPYTLAIFSQLLAANWQVVSALLAVAFALLVLVVGAKALASQVVVPASLARWAGWGVNVVLLSAGLWAYFVRPIGLDGSAVTGDSEMALRAAFSDRQSLVRLGWYFSPIGLGLGIAGFARLLTKPQSFAARLLYLCAAIEGTLFLWRAMITPEQFWAVRRFLPLVIPVLSMSAAYGVYQLGKVRPRGLGLAVSLIVGFFLVWQLVKPGWAFYGAVEYEGAASQIRELAERFPTGAVVVVQWSALGGKLPTPLMLIHDHAAFAVEEETLKDPGFRRAIERWNREGRAVIYLRHSRGPLSPSPGIIQIRQGEVVIDVPQAEVRFDQLPERVNRLRLEFDIYQLQPET